MNDCFSYMEAKFLWFADAQRAQGFRLTACLLPQRRDEEMSFGMPVEFFR
jgi:hypothetical protein